MKKKIVVVMGGSSAEHEISLRSGREILKNLNQDKYSSSVVIISMDTKFYWCEDGFVELTMDMLRTPQNYKEFSSPYLPCESSLIWENCDVALLALHGEFGEDGTFQGFLKTIGVKFTGSGIGASAVGMDKIFTKYLYEQSGILTPSYSVYRTDDKDAILEKIGQKHGYPVFVKCPQSGSSRLMGKAHSFDELWKFVKEYWQHTKRVLIEEEVLGDEYSCPVLSLPNGECRVLSPILIKHVDAEYFDFKAKYSDDATEEIVPAPCSDDLTKNIKETALIAHRTLGCDGLSRTDMIVKGSTIYALETNTLPGLTTSSLAPKAFNADGGTYSELLDILINDAVKMSRC